jgi:valyl-tRNA synthetase
VVRDLEEQGLLVKVEEHRHAVGHCHRCGSAAEPLVSKQWYVKMKPLAAPAIEAVKKGEVKFVPERFSKIYLNWMENIRDWCISRQLWWGHRIPAWYCDNCGETIVQVEPPPACPACGGGEATLRQDEDVLDTWFSSALWPFSTLGWPDRTPELDFFFPTSVLVTAYDIIFFWVARMIYSSYHFMGGRPFDYTFIHGLVRAADGRKMSKSLGTGVDPLETIDRYGADALRFSLVIGTAPGNDMRFNTEKVEGARNFANKLWNASRFVLMNLGDGAAELEGMSRSALEEAARKSPDPADRWIASRYRSVVAGTDRLLGSFELGEAARTLYDFTWSEFCDWYIEMVKPRLYGEDEESRRLARLTLTYVLDGILRLLHPFMPFVTEEIWQKLPAISGERRSEVGGNPLPDTAGRPRTIVLAPWPAPPGDLRDEALEEQVSLVIDVVRAIRNLRAEMNVPPGKRSPVILVAEGDKASAALMAGRAFIQDLAFVTGLEVTRVLAERPRQAAAAVTRGVEVFLPLRGLVDLDRESARLGSELAGARQDLARVRGKLDNREFVNKAPAAVVEREREKAAELELKCERLAKRLAWLKEEAHLG